MDVPAKGQVGGIESDDVTRRRLAGESRGWKCAACAKSNAEVLEEQEKLAQEAGSSEGQREVEKVPEELKLVYKDDLEGNAKAETATPTNAIETAVSATPGPIPSPPPVAIAPPPAPRLQPVHPVPPRPARQQRQNGHADDIQLDAAIWVVSGILVILVSRMLVKMFT